MNANLTKALSIVPMLVHTVQVSATPGMTGAQKTQAVLAGVTQAIPDDISPIVPEIKFAINALVAMWSTFHPAFMQPGTASGSAIQ